MVQGEKGGDEWKSGFVEGFFLALAILDQGNGFVEKGARV